MDNNMNINENEFSKANSEPIPEELCEADTTAIVSDQISEAVIEEAPAPLPDRSKDIRKFFTSLGLGFLAFSLASAILSRALAFLIYFFAPSLLDSAVVSYLINAVPMYLFGIPWLLLITSGHKSVTLERKKLSLAGVLGYLAVSVAFMFVGNMISNILIIAFEIIKGETMVNPLSEFLSAGEWWINLIFVAIIAPIVEELLFRKIICGKLLPYGELTAVICSAIIFGFAHENFFQLFYATFIGIILAYIYIKTGKLRYTVFIHIFINLVFGVFSSEISRYALEKLEAAGDNILLQLAASLPIILLNLFMYSLTIVGVVIFFVKLKKISLNPTPADIKSSSLAKNIFLSVGTILLLVYFAVTMFLSVLI